MLINCFFEFTFKDLKPSETHDFIAVFKSSVNSCLLKSFDDLYLIIRGSFFGTEAFINVATILWKSESPVSMVAVLKNLCLLETQM